MPLSFRHLTAAAQITKNDADILLKTAVSMEKVVEKGGNDALNGKILAALFYEPSTRTRLSFEAAMLRLGGQVITADGFQFSSLYKGETIEDTMVMVGSYADIIAMRHPEAGSADKAAAASPVPFINAGDGANQHPTQALLDLFTVQKERGTVDGLHIAVCGDLKFGRASRSMVELLALYKNMRFTFVAPDELKMPAATIDLVKKAGHAVDETSDLRAGVDADVLYMTRVQKERFDDPAQYERLKLAFVLSADMLKGKKVTVMHPLPRVGEITTDVDALPNAAYFREAKNGLFMRMALLKEMLA
jgi:aspartate carbamoyltransferase catalytic subunit